MTDEPDRETLWSEYCERVPHELYPVQQEAILQWFTAEQGVLVCAPTGTGKTLIAEAAVYEALRTGRRLYYTTPLIALTDQKLDELRATARRWGFDDESIGLVTGNRRVAPDAPVLVVVAEILMNRLMHPEAFDFADVGAVVMDEFHSFNEPERGIVWEITLGLLPKRIRTMLLSATVGNAYEFSSWLRTRHERDLSLVESTDRKVPLEFHWIGDELLADQIERMYEGNEESRKTPALVFCFNRDECWSVAQELRGRKLVDAERQQRLSERLASFDLSRGAGPTLKQLLQRGVGVHHAGVLPKHRRIVETLFQEKLLSITVCTETLAAGINLPARSVVLPSLVKGPSGDRKLIDPSAAHQMFGRAGRPQFDSRGFVYAIAHEDDVRFLRWKEKYDQIPEETKDPGLMKAKKALKKKMPKRRENETYWSREQFEQLRDAPPTRLSSRGGLPWRLLAFLLLDDADVAPLREIVSKRLLPPPRIEQGLVELHRMLTLLHRGGFARLDPPPQDDRQEGDEVGGGEASGASAPAEPLRPTLTLGGIGGGAPLPAATPAPKAGPAKRPSKAASLVWPKRAEPLPKLERMSRLRSVHPIYGVFLEDWLHDADREERLQAFESLLEMPASVGPAVRVPWPPDLPFGPVARERLDPVLLQLGLATPGELLMQVPGEEEEKEPKPGERPWMDEPPPRPLVFAEKLRRLFDHEFPGANPPRIQPVWVAGELLRTGLSFDDYVTSFRLQKQEGIIFRHLLRLVLLLREFAEFGALRDADEPERIDWTPDLRDLADAIAAICREVDPQSTDEYLQESDLGNSGI